MKKYRVITDQLVYYHNTDIIEQRLDLIEGKIVYVKIGYGIIKEDPLNQNVVENTSEWFEEITEEEPIIKDRYEGCHPIIAKALKENKVIKCVLENDKSLFIEGWVMNYASCLKYPYIAIDKNGDITYWKHAEPIK